MSHLQSPQAGTWGVVASVAPGGWWRAQGRPGAAPLLRGLALSCLTQLSFFQTLLLPQSCSSLKISRPTGLPRAAFHF